jgi:hypothetical protein
MSLRIFSASICLLVTACGGPPEGVESANVQEALTGTPTEAPTEYVECAVGAENYAPACTIERAAADDGTVLTIRHPDGGFHRLRLSADGQDVAAADGALPAKILARAESAIDVAIGDARYRLPTTR